MSIEAEIFNNSRRFIRFQIRQISNQGWKALLSKIYKALLILVAFPIVVIIRLLTPLLLIRYGELRSNRIGHFAFNTEMFFCERDCAEIGKNTYDIFFHINPISNWQLKKMWDRKMCVLKFSHLMRMVKRVNRLIPGYQKYEIDLSKSRDVKGLLMRISPHISFTKEEEAFGCQQLRKMGIEESDSFICFHARDSKYLDDILPLMDWRYHDYRDCSIGNYITAAEELCKRDYFMIRMGAKVKEPIKVSNKKIIDYAVKYRTDFMDIYLGAKCRFFLACSSGIDEIAKVFRRPIAHVNLIPLSCASTWYSGNVFISKKLWLKSEKRFLTFREILGSAIGGFSCSQQYEQSGIEVIENTPEEITALAIEMDQRLKGQWQSSEGDEELQQRFWSLFKLRELNRVFRARIGAEFLRQNKELLR